MFDACLFGDRAVRLVVTRWVVWALTYLDMGNLSIFDDKYIPLATRIAEGFCRSRVIHHHAHSLGELGSSVCKEGDEAIVDLLFATTIHLLILCPGLHDSAIIDA
jgi:hypothetical protein